MRYSWNANDELATTTYPNGRVVTTTYQSIGMVNPVNPYAAMVATKSDAVGTILSVGVNGNIVTQTNGEEEQVTTTFGVRGVVSSIRGPDGVLTEFKDHNARGLPAKRGVGDFEEGFQYDAAGRMTVGNDGSSTGSQMPGITGRTFDQDDNRSSLIMSENENGVPQDVVSTYRSDGRRLADYIASGLIARYLYDGLGRLKEKRVCVSFPAGTVLVGTYNTFDNYCRGNMSESTYFEYNELSQRTGETLSNGMRQQYKYDAAGRVRLRENFLNYTHLESSIAYTYERGRLAFSVDSSLPSSANTKRVTYDSAGRVWEVWEPSGERRRFFNNARNQNTQVTFFNASGSVVFRYTASYDLADRAVEWRDTTLGNRLLKHETFSQGRLVANLSGNGLAQTIPYDEFGRPKGHETKNAQGVIVATEEVEYEGRGWGGVLNPSGPMFTTSVNFRAKIASEWKTTYEETTGFAGQGGVHWVSTFADTQTQSFIGSASNDGQSFFMYTPTMALKAERFANPVKSRVFERTAEGDRLLRILNRSGDYWDETAPTKVECEYRWDSAGFATSACGLAMTHNATGKMTSYGSQTRTYNAEGKMTGFSDGVRNIKLLWGGLGASVDGGAPIIDLGFFQIDTGTHEELWRYTDYRNNHKFKVNQFGEIESMEVYSPWRLERTEKIDGAQDDARSFAQASCWANFCDMGERTLDMVSGQFMEPEPDPLWQLFNPYTWGAGDPLHYGDPSGRHPEESTGQAVSGIVGMSVGAAYGALAGAGMGGPWGAAAGAFVGTMYGAAGKEFGEMGYNTFMTNPQGPMDVSVAGKNGRGFNTSMVNGPQSVRDRSKGPKHSDPWGRFGGGGGGGSGGPGSAGAGISGGGACGLIGIEPFLVLFLLKLIQGRRRLFFD
jgi:hypothetical protein